MKISKTISIALVTIAVLSVALGYALFQLQRQVTHTINVVGVYEFRVYKDALCTQELSAVNWATVNKGTTTYYYVWIKNTGDTHILINWNTTETNPHNGITLGMERDLGDGVTWATWTYNTEKINVIPTAAIIGRIVLTVASDATTGTTTFTQNFGGYDA